MKNFTFVVDCNSSITVVVGASRSSIKFLFSVTWMGCKFLQINMCMIKYLSESKLGRTMGLQYVIRDLFPMKTILLIVNQSWINKKLTKSLYKRCKPVSRQRMMQCSIFWSVEGNFWIAWIHRITILPIKLLVTYRKTITALVLSQSLYLSLCLHHSSPSRI